MLFFVACVGMEIEVREKGREELRLLTRETEVDHRPSNALWTSGRGSDLNG